MMNLIKLNAIDSTNEYIKLNKSFFSQNSLAVYSFNQTNGKGQRGKKWISEPYKNNCISFYFRVLKPSKDTLLKTYAVFYFLFRGVHTRHYQLVGLDTFCLKQTFLYVDINRHSIHESSD